ncbi:GyrI-like domain-containing protein [Gorillibacterium sp. sgz500922]|uniref:GyrI-like domain-containing protein n=1 Tax=Gorillibacterium sp. sgz500922 TaxID=3446694 RepID=UPI003F66CD5D
MSTAPKPKRSPYRNPDGYSPKDKPLIVSMAEKAASALPKESFVQQVNQWTSIVDRAETRIVGIAVPASFESRGYGYIGEHSHSVSTFNDAFFARKLIEEGEIALLARAIGIELADADIVSARYDVEGDGNYRMIVGLALDRPIQLPEALPENTATLTVPASRYAKLLINEQRREDRAGYDERMKADEYFIAGFRQETPYVYDNRSFPLNMYDAAGDMLTKYEPVKIPASEAERHDSIRFRVVVLPEMKIACSMTPPDSEEFVIAKYFEIEPQVLACEAARYYINDYYGFPTDAGEGKINSFFGTRVSTFDELPDGVEKVTLPGGLYVHVTQLEVNGDNPAMPYDVAFNHLDALFLQEHPNYERDWSRHVIARFRQANCASVFVPLSRKNSPTL